MEFTHKEFNIESYPNITLRIAKISPVDLLAITGQLDFENFKQSKTLINFCLENTEVKQGEAWFPVKVKDKDFYSPVGIEDNIKALNEIVSYLITEVIEKVFQ